MRRAGPGHAPGWAPLPVQYADYTLWQQDWLGVESDPDSVTAAQLAYWRQALAGLPEVVSLPTDRPRPAVPSYRGDGVDVRIDAQTWAGVKALAAAHGATVSMVLQAAMAVVLHRAGAGEDVALGTPIAGRMDPALDELVGFFVNTWVLRVGVNPALQFGEVLAQVRNTALDAYGNQDVPFELLVERLNPSRSTSHHPLFQVLVVFQNNVRPEVVLDGAAIEPLSMDTHTAKFDLDFQLSEVLGEAAGAPMCAGTVTYATDLFDRSTIERLVGWFGRVIEAVVADSSVVVGEVALLDGGERELVLDRWSGADVGAPVGLGPELLAAAVASDPDGLAVVDGVRQWSYRELDEASNRLARVLIEAGVGPERAVGVAMGRCAELVVAWWAVLKAGGIYVPVDRTHPEARVAMVLDAAGAVCVLSCGADVVAGAGARPVVRVDGSGRLGCVSADPVTDAQRLAPQSVDDAAYVIFTSGSTGTPKGVTVTHAGLLGWAAAQRERFGLSAHSRVLMVAAPTFDASVGEWLLAVASGAALVVAAAGFLCRGGVDRAAARAARRCGDLDSDGAGDPGSGPAGRVEHGDRGGGGRSGGVGGGVGAGAADVQRLRPQRGHHLGDVCVAEGGAAGADRGSDRRSRCVGARWAVQPGPGRDGRRVVSGWACAGAWLRGSSGVDRGSVRGQPVRGSRGADVSHR